MNVAFALSPIRDGERYLAAAKAAKEETAPLAALIDHPVGPEESAALAAELRGETRTP